MLSFELMWKCAKKAMSDTTNPLAKIVRLILFFLRSWFFDLEYKEFTMQEFQEVVNKFRQWCEEKQLHYKYEYFDCDDFAMEFKSFCAREFNHNGVIIALGMVSKDGRVLGGHAWNIVIIEGRLYYFEPQTFELIDGNTSTDGFKYELMAVVG